MRSWLVILLAASALGLSGSAYARNKRCGLGSKLFGHSQGILSQTAEVTVNELAYGQASITSGTSGCKHDGNFLFDPIGMRQDDAEFHYVDSNYDALMLEMATGSGGVLDGFALILGCQSDNLDGFRQHLRDQFDVIWPSEGLDAEGVLQRVKDQITEHEVLAKACLSSLG